MTGWAAASRWPYRGRGDGLEQMGPVLEHDIAVTVRRCSKKRYVAPRAMMAARQARTAETSGGVEREGEQIEGDQDAGEGFLAVPEIVFEIVTVGLEHVEGLVLDLPTGAAAGGQFGDGVGGDRADR